MGRWDGGHVIRSPKQNTWKSETPKGLCIYLWSPVSAFRTSGSSAILANV